MPRRRDPDDLPDEDDDYDAPRRANASGGGVPAWVAGLGVLAAFVCVGVGLLAYRGVRAERLEAARADVARAEAAQAEAARGDAARGAAAKADPAVDPKDAPIIEARDLFREYEKDAAGAKARYAGRELRVRMRVDNVEQAGGKVVLTHRLRIGSPQRVDIRVPAAEAGIRDTGRLLVVVGKVGSQGPVDVTLDGHIEP